MTKKYFPICLDVQGRKCLVAGGGAVGARKAASLEKCGAEVRVVSPVFSEKFTPLKNRISCIQKPYDPSDLDGMFLVMAATDQPDLNKKIARDAAERGILCNIADGPGLSAFILPSVIRRGDLTIAVSTSGTSPAFAKKLRKRLEEQFGEEHADFLHLMGKIRKRLVEEDHDPEQHKRIFTDLINSDLPALIKTGNTKAVDTLLAGILGRDFPFEGIRP